MDPAEAELMSELIVESKEHLENVELILLEMEKGNTATDGEINEIFRCVHSIKGGFGFFHISKIVDLTHVMENTLAKLKAKSIDITPPLVSAILVGIDKVKLLMDCIDEMSEIEVSDEIELFRGFLGKPSQKDEKPQIRAVDALFQLEFSLENWEDFLLKKMSEFLDNKDVIAVRLNISKEKEAEFFSEINSLPGMKGRFVFLDSKGIKSLGDSISTWVSGFHKIVFLNLLHDLEFLELVLETTRENMALVIPIQESEKLILESEEEIKTLGEQPLRGFEQSLVREDQLKRAMSTPKRGESEVIRVKVSLLNNLIDHAGEMVLNRNQLLQIISRRLGEVLGEENLMGMIDVFREDLKRRLLLQNHSQLNDEKFLKDFLGSEFEALKKTIGDYTNIHFNEIRDLNNIVQSLDRNTTHLQETIMKTRMQGIEILFNRFPRMVRDLSKGLNKDVEVVVTSSNVELDKTIIEKLGDPMVHLIRNSVDHGIESAEQREKVGKPKIGTIYLSAVQEGGKIIISIKDDGGGINTAKVRELAISRGVINSSQAKEMTDGEIHELIFQAGFSTSNEVTDISGRGVGMDVVKTNISSIGGTIEIYSTEGKGTQFVMKLPLTLAIIPAMIVASHKLRFTIPQMLIEELVGIPGAEVTKKIQRVHDNEVIRLRDDVLPLIRLAEVLKVSPMFKDLKTGEWKEDKRARWSDRREDRLGEVPEDITVRRSGRDRRESINNDLTVIVLKHGENRFGLVVNEVLDSEEIVVKPLPTLLKNCLCYSGTTILGDGGVAMILDANGLAQIANFRFGRFNEEKAAVRKHYEKTVMVENQNYLIFDNFGDEKFALHMDMIGRVEKIPKSKIQKIGNKGIVNLEQGDIRVIELWDFLPLSARVEPEEQDFLYVIIPKLVSHPIGILCGNIVDTLKLKASLKDDIVKAKGMIGTLRSEEDLVILLDLYSLFEIVDPEIYSREMDPHFLNGKRVLLAEDTEFFRKVVSSFLRELGANLSVFENGLEAWKAIEAGQKFDIVVTDIQMPLMDGFELTKMIRERSSISEIPIMALTSMNLLNYRNKGSEVGIDRYELKFDKERQKKTLKELMVEKGI